MKISAQTQIFGRVSFLDKLMFTKHFAVMIKSGIPLSEAVSTLEEQTKSQSFKTVLGGVLKEINNGQTLSKALSLYPKIFDPLYLSLITIGEKSGKLEENLEHLINQQTKSYEFRKKVEGAMLYPIIVLTAALLAGGGLSLFVLPKLVDLFNSLDVKLPLTTQVLLFTANVMKNYGIFIVGGAALFLIGFYFLIHTQNIKPKWHKFLLSLPILGTLMENMELSSLCRNLGIMLKSGLPIMSALEAEQKALGNLVYKDYLGQMLKSVDKGKSLEETLSSGKFTHIPHFMAKMIGVGEKTGKLEDTLIYLGDFFEEEVDNTTKNLSNILEPILLLVIGVVVGFVALAIISPIYQLTGSIRAR